MAAGYAFGISALPADYMMMGLAAEVVIFLIAYSFAE
jgi:hypothetical protein